MRGREHSSLRGSSPLSQLSLGSYYLFIFWFVIYLTLLIHFSDFYSTSFQSAGVAPNTYDTNVLTFQSLTVKPRAQGPMKLLYQFSFISFTAGYLKGKIKREEIRERREPAKQKTEKEGNYQREKARFRPCKPQAS